MSDNVEEVQESTPEPQEQVEAQPQQQPQEPQNLSEQPQEGGHIREELLDDLDSEGWHISHILGGRALVLMQAGTHSA